MGSSLSKTTICVLGAGIAIVIATASLSHISRRISQKPVNANNAVFITGCDSGLGFSLAVYAYKLGFTVWAGCLQLDGEGARELRRRCSTMQIIQLDITDTHSVNAAVQRVQNFLVESPNLELKALINNAGVMVFGEFEWLTEKHISNQVNVNLLGTMRITKALCPLLRKYKGRIITISSHCALATLPGLAVYGATKAGLAAWCDGLRIEQAKYGVKVITFIPGSFTPQSSIMARQKEYSHEMEEEMSEDDYKYFADYFKRFNKHLSGIPFPEKPTTIQDETLYLMFEEALIAKNPKSHYVHAPFRYSYYHFLFKISPTKLRDYFVQRFMQMPTWKEEH